MLPLRPWVVVVNPPRPTTAVLNLTKNRTQILLMHADQRRSLLILPEKSVKICVHPENLRPISSNSVVHDCSKNGGVSILRCGSCRETRHLRMPTPRQNRELLKLRIAGPTIWRWPERRFWSSHSPVQQASADQRFSVQSTTHLSGFVPGVCFCNHEWHEWHE